MDAPLPETTYRQRLDARRAQLAEAQARIARISNLRLLVAGGFVGVLIAVAAVPVSALWLIVPALAFVVLVVVHGQVGAAEQHAERGVAFYEDGLRRVTDAWAGRGRTGEAYLPDEHLFGLDLDLVGKGSLFERLNRARTALGERRLVRWLARPAAPDVIRARQAAVEELTPDLDFREDLAVVAREVRTAIDREGLAPWAQAPRRLQGTAFRVVMGLLAATTVTLLLLAFFGVLPYRWFWLAAFVQTLVSFLKLGTVHAVLGEADRPADDLALLARLLRRIEAERFEAPHLKAAVAPLATDPPPSAHIGRLGRLMAWVEARRNQIFFPIAALLGLGTQLAYELERWRAEHGAQLDAWLEAVAEVEALVSFAAFAFENPTYCRPEILDGAPRIAAETLGHPLIPASARIANDLALASEHAQVLIVSGSNMSGKTTMLRTVGVAVALAQAGAVVCATRFALTPLRVGASIRTQDSLLEGRSRFYAEIARLKDVVDESGRGPGALFLFDEILHGTNSHDRRIGAAAIVRSLLARDALGLVTTHDLALGKLADDLAPQVVNVHFQDTLVDGELIFDYRMRPGVVEHSNALELMRSVGLEVDAHPSEQR